MYSELINGVLLSPFCNSPRNDSIRGIAIHHMAGVMSGHGCAEYEQHSNNSANYCIGVDGDIWCAVDESDRAWTTGGAWDNHLITIEVSNDECGGDWHVSDKSIDALIKLCADICRRYDFRLHYTGEQDASLVMHNQFQPTACPGPYLQNLIKNGTIENEVNKIIDSNVPQDDMIVYKILDDNGWGAEHTGYNEFDSENGYCQATGHIRGIAMYVLHGIIEYQVKVGDTWLPMVTGYNTDDSINGWAGNGEPINAVRCYYHAPNGGNHNLCAYYRVGVACEGMQGQQQDDSTDNGMWGAAIGASYRDLDKFMIKIA